MEHAIDNHSTGPVEPVQEMGLVGVLFLLVKNAIEHQPTAEAERVRRKAQDAAYKARQRARGR